MQGPHRTILTYFITQEGEERELEVGEVSCVPHKGDHVHIGDQHYLVELVSWTPDPTMLEDYNRPDMVDRRPLMTTWVGVTLRRSSARRKK